MPQIGSADSAHSGRRQVAVRHGMFVVGDRHETEPPLLRGMLPLVSPQTHRQIDQLTLRGLLATSTTLPRFDKQAAAITLTIAGVEGAAYLTTDYPAALTPLISFRGHNRRAMAHCSLVIGLALMAPGSRRGAGWPCSPDATGHSIIGNRVS